MREHKFKVYHEEHGMSEPIDIYDLGIMVLEGAVKLNEVKVLQWTGLKDKNDIEIYEGYIVKCTDGTIVNIGAVEWCQEFGFWNVTKIENSLGDLICDEDVEVIGNIFDDPKLLEVG